ncbi:MAG: cytochrome c [Flavobacteriales bacterium]|nr:cytochrome c [Flavobacteriales bacterium]
MSLKTKQWLYAVLCMSFLAMSLSVYVNTENVDRGSELMSAEVMQGRQLFMDYNCTSCHQIFGLGGYMGPDLTNCYSSDGGPQRAEMWLRNGFGAMPNLELSDQEISELMAFLAYIDRTGTSPPKDFEINAIGTVDIEHYKEDE